MIWKRFFAVFFFALASVIFAAGCSEDDDPVSSNNQVEKTRVKVVHASPDAPGVDLLVDNKIVGTNLTYPQNTDYLELEAGMHNIKVNVTGTSTTVINADVNLDANKNYSVFAVDAVSNLSTLILSDELNQPAEGKAHIRFIHLSPDAPSVDITLADGSTVFSNKSFKDYTDFTPLDAGTYDLQVRVAGTQTVALNLPGIVLEEGKIYTVFAKGFLNGSNSQALGAEIIIH